MRRGGSETYFEGDDVRSVPCAEENRAMRAVSLPLSLVLRCVHIRVSFVRVGAGGRPRLVWVAMDACEGIIRRCRIFGVHLPRVHCLSRSFMSESIQEKRRTESLDEE